MHMRSIPSTWRLFLSIVAAAIAAGVLGACGGGGTTDPQDLFGEVSFPPTADVKIAAGTLYVRISENEGGAQVTEHVERGVNMFPVQFNLHPFSMKVPELQDGETYVIDVHVDVDLDGVISAPDFVTAETFTFVAKSGLDAAIIPVVSAQ